MKQVLLTLCLLLLVMVGFYWITNRFQPKKEVKLEVIDRELYFQVPENLTVGTENEIKLMARHESGNLVSFLIEFNYDPTAIKILNIEVNKDIFDKVAQSKVNEDFGKVSVVGENMKKRETLKSGEVLLATIKVNGLKKGTAMIYASRRPEVGILDNGKVSEGNFQMPNFKVNFL